MQDLGDEHKFDVVGVETQGHGMALQYHNRDTVTFRIQNPLFDVEPRDLMRRVQRFVELTQWPSRNIEILKLGSILAKNPNAINNMEEFLAAGQEAYGNLRPLDADEVQHLKNERDAKWHQPENLYFTIILCSIGAAVQGWDQVGTNGANLLFPQQLGITHNTWLIGFINAAPYIVSATLGCWLTDPLNHHFGRRGTIFTGATISLLTVIGSAFSQKWQHLLICRLLLGIGMSFKASTVPVFAAENSPSQIRGALVMGWQMWVAFGIFLGLSANLAVNRAGDITWRLQLGSAMLPAIPLVMAIYLCPESPRWYMKSGQYKGAYKSLCRLRNSELQAARDIFYIHAQLDIEKEEASRFDKEYLTRFQELFTKKRLRQATLASWTVMIAQQMCGINIIAFYSSSIFTDAGASYVSALWASWGFGLVNFLFAFPALFTIDSYGRRTLLLFTFPQMAWTLLAAGSCFYVKGDKGAHLGLVAFFIYLFGVFYSPGEGPVPFTYSAEAFPLSHREIGMSFAVATNLFWAAVLGLTFPSMRVAMGPTGTFGFYAGLNMIAFIMIFLFVPETREKSLEDLDGVFAVPVRKFAGYQVNTAIPYWYKRYMRSDKDAKRKELYEFIDLTHA
ncbi:MAG: hypothetical protein M1827_002578 [Pycnora praestabilis]|nr:MAG: hypothetical protein M1827_002578 [Pycnora praestabilis]